MLGLSGWVCNLSSGEVRTELQGEARAVESLLQWAHQGPSGARVDGVAVDELGLIDDEPAGFTIRY